MTPTHVCPLCPNTASTPIPSASAWCTKHLGDSVPMRKVTT